MPHRINRAMKSGDRRELVFYSMLPFGILTILSIMYTALNLYFTDVLGLSIASVGVILTVSRIWDAINDPVMGLIVDKTKTKWGKCRPYVLWTALPVAVLFAFLFYPVNFKGNGNFVYALFMYLLFYAANTALDIPYQGLTPLLFPENKTRVKAVSVGNIVGSLGTILPSVLFFTVAGSWGRQREKEGYFYTALIFAVIGCVFIMASFFGIREKVYIPPKKTNLRQVLQILFTDKKMVLLMISFIFNAAINLGATFLPYFAKWNCIGVLPVDSIGAWLSAKLHMDIALTSEGLLTPILHIGSGLSYMLSLALIPWLLKFTDKRRLMIWTSLLGAVASVLTYVIGVWAVPYNTAPGLVLYIALRFFTNFPVGMCTVLFIAMFSDVTDDLELRHGERLEGSVFSFKSLLMKLSWSLFNIIMLSAVAAFGYDIDRMKQVSNGLTERLVVSTTRANVIGGVNYTALMNAIFFMLTAAAAIGLVLQAIPLFFYDFDEAAQEGKLKAFREEKERKLQNELMENNIS